MASEHEYDAHLEDHPEGVANVVGVELLEALGTVAALEQESVAHGGLPEPLLQAPRLAGEDDGRERLEGPEHGLERVRIRVLGELEGVLGLPALEGPLRGDRGGRR